MHGQGTAVVPTGSARAGNGPRRITAMSAYATALRDGHKCCQHNCCRKLTCAGQQQFCTGLRARQPPCLLPQPPSPFGCARFHGPAGNHERVISCHLRSFADCAAAPDQVCTCEQAADRTQADVVMSNSLKMRRRSKYNLIWLPKFFQAQPCPCFTSYQRLQIPSLLQLLYSCGVHRHSLHMAPYSHGACC